MTHCICTLICTTFFASQHVNYTNLRCINYTQTLKAGDIPGLPADGGEGADPAAVELVAAARADHLEVERLVKLAQLLGLEP